ncbi:hypothetical protein AAG570_001476 [Ranatra chinensis]|uniref:Kinesin motor domain-containing protein n=1 Tax=Ranatra chinensis TaxID=642074 RepID=A0ABD0YR93_9HEMI
MGPTTGEDDGIYPETGVIPRFCRELLERCQRVEEETEGGSVREGFNGKKRAITSTVEVSYLEVYNEKIHDLLVAGTQCVPLKVREHPIYGPYVVDLSKHTVNSFKEMQHWLNEGNKKRATAATELNDKSSRSHSLFIIVLTQTEESDGTWTHEQTRTSSINLVDLAGSERIAHYSISNDRLREGVSINRSLLTLGKVITCLVEKRNFVPYRDSVLTRLLKVRPF